MSLVQAKCVNCNANLEVDDSKDAAICPCCGTPYIVEKAIQNFNISNNISAENVIIQNGNASDFVIRAGVLEKYVGESDKVFIPSNVKIIGEKAFFECYGLSAVQIPEGVTEIGYRAFRCCKNLESVIIPESVKKIGKEAFEYCESLPSVFLPSNVVIGEDAFCGCSELFCLEIKPGTTVGYGAFKRCRRLWSVHVPERVTFMDTIRVTTGWASNKIVNVWQYTGDVDDNYPIGCICPFYGCDRLEKITWEGKLNPDIFSGTLWHQKFSQQREQERMAKGLCRHCGGTFSGLIKKICKNCGCLKDY